MTFKFSDANNVLLEAFEAFIGTRSANMLNGEFSPTDLTPLGGTNGGINVVFTPEYKDIIFDQFGTARVDKIRTGALAQVSGNFLETKAYKNLEYFIHALDQDAGKTRHDVKAKIGASARADSFVLWVRPISEAAKVSGESIGTGDASTTDFNWANDALPVLSEIKVYVDGTLQTITTDYTLDVRTKTVSFVTAPAASAALTIDYIQVSSRNNDRVFPHAQVTEEFTLNGTLDTEQSYDISFDIFAADESEGGQIMILGDYTQTAP